jgi:hypothetical protein
MKLLDDLEGEVDKGTRALKRETARADHIAADTRSCWLYVTICILIAILVALVRSARRRARVHPHPLTPLPTLRRHGSLLRGSHDTPLLTFLMPA